MEYSEIIIILGLITIISLILVLIVLYKLEKYKNKYDLIKENFEELVLEEKETRKLYLEYRDKYLILSRQVRAIIEQ